MSGKVVSSMLKSPGISLIEKSNPQKQIITMLKLLERYSRIDWLFPEQDIEGI